MLKKIASFGLLAAAALIITPAAQAQSVQMLCKTPQQRVHIARSIKR
jgi:hypothetical protein